MYAGNVRLIGDLPAARHGRAKHGLTAHEMPGTYAHGTLAGAGSDGSQGRWRAIALVGACPLEVIGDVRTGVPAIAREPRPRRGWSTRRWSGCSRASNRSRRARPAQLAIAIADIAAITSATASEGRLQTPPQHWFFPRSRECRSRTSEPARRGRPPTPNPHERCRVPEGEDVVDLAAILAIARHADPGTDWDQHERPPPPPPGSA
jgi:hypothetical protein